MIAEAERDSVRSGGMVIDIGNSSIKLGLWCDKAVTGSVRVPNDDTAGLAKAIARLLGRQADDAPTDVAIASTEPNVLKLTRSMLVDGGAEAFVVGEEIPLPVPTDVEVPEQVGVDRLCSAAAAHDRTGHACIVIDFGSAITVDLIGDDGVFLGGAILPGLAMQRAALHERTAALPLVEPSLPKSPVGRSTQEAIRSGIVYGTVGAVRGLVERFAGRLGTWPQVLATGGDLELLKDECDFCDSLVPDLGLMGVGLAYARWRRDSS